MTFSICLFFCLFVYSVCLSLFCCTFFVAYFVVFNTDFCCLFQPVGRRSAVGGRRSGTSTSITNSTGTSTNTGTSTSTGNISSDLARRDLLGNELSSKSNESMRQKCPIEVPVGVALLNRVQKKEGMESLQRVEVQKYWYYYY